MTFAPFGQIDVGTPDGMGNLPDVVIIADGNVPQFPDLLFYVGPAGVTNMSFPVPVGLARIGLRSAVRHLQQRHHLRVLERGSRVDHAVEATGILT